jgi:hypothetical protein
MKRIKTKRMRFKELVISRLQIYLNLNIVFGTRNVYHQKIKRGYDFHHNPLFYLVGTIGFEPTTPTVSG